MITTIKGNHKVSARAHTIHPIWFYPYIIYMENMSCKSLLLSKRIHSNRPSHHHPEQTQNNIWFAGWSSVLSLVVACVLDCTNALTLLTGLLHSTFLLANRGFVVLVHADAAHTKFYTCSTRNVISRVSNQQTQSDSLIKHHTLRSAVLNEHVLCSTQMLRI